MLYETVGILVTLAAIVFAVWNWMAVVDNVTQSSFELEFGDHAVTAMVVLFVSMVAGMAWPLLVLAAATLWVKSHITEAP